MSQFKIIQNRAVHDGGTKYYQTIVILAPNGESMIYFNHGKYTPGQGFVPREHGKLDFYGVATGTTAADRKMRDKSKRGYVSWKSFGENQPLSFEQMKNAVTTMFPPLEANKIITFFESFEEDYSRHSGGKIISFETASTDANWGSW